MNGKEEKGSLPRGGGRGLPWWKSAWKESGKTVARHVLEWVEKRDHEPVERAQTLSEMPGETLRRMGREERQHTGWSAVEAVSASRKEGGGIP